MMLLLLMVLRLLNDDNWLNLYLWLYHWLHHWLSLWLLENQYHVLFSLIRKTSIFLELVVVRLMRRNHQAMVVVSDEVVWEVHTLE